MADIPVFRITLEGMKFSLLTVLEDKVGEMRQAVEAGVEAAIKKLPALVAERCHTATIEAIEEATNTAIQEYYGPGGKGYEQIMEQVSKNLKRREE